MTPDDAWRILGVVPASVYARIIDRPRHERAVAAEEELIEARRLARQLQGRCHPDRSKDGDEKRFREISEALETLVHATENFKIRLAEVISEEESAIARKSRTAVFIRMEK
jgi:hypothetical protein